MFLWNGFRARLGRAEHPYCCLLELLGCFRAFVVFVLHGNLQCQINTPNPRAASHIPTQTMNALQIKSEVSRGMCTFAEKSRLRRVQKKNSPAKPPRERKIPN